MSLFREIVKTLSYPESIKWAVIILAYYAISAAAFRYYVLKRSIK